MSAAKWTYEELAILRAHYRHEGFAWDGWESLLPGRTQEAIRRQATKQGLTGNNPPPIPKPPRRKPRRSHMLVVDESESYVLGKMKSGMTLSDIDKSRGWFPGRAKLILTSMWERESN